MTSRSDVQVSLPRWVGSSRGNHLGGPALIAFGLVLWALFLGTVGISHDSRPDAIAGAPAALR